MTTGVRHPKEKAVEYTNRAMDVLEGEPHARGDPGRQHPEPGGLLLRWEK